MTGHFQNDPRLTPARPDLAASQLRGTLEAPRYADGRAETVIAGIIDVRGEPSPGASLTTQALRGEKVQVYDVEEGWAWGQLEDDGYVGYMPAAALAPWQTPATHRVSVLSTFLYPGPSMKLPVAITLPLNAQLAITAIDGDFARVENEGYVWAAHIAPLAAGVADYVSVAEQFIGTPYLWGGKSSHGIDCSGLVQVSLQAAGEQVLRDTDMQEGAIGTGLLSGADVSGPPEEWPCQLQRGDLVFWRGHVGIMRDATTLLHANGHHMMVASEPLAIAVERIKTNSFGAVTSVRRTSP